VIAAIASRRSAIPAGSTWPLQAVSTTASGFQAYSSASSRGRLKAFSTAISAPIATTSARAIAALNPTTPKPSPASAAKSSSASGGWIVGISGWSILG